MSFENDLRTSNESKVHSCTRHSTLERFEGVKVDNARPASRLGARWSSWEGTSVGGHGQTVPAAVSTRTNGTTFTRREPRLPN